MFDDRSRRFHIEINSIEDFHEFCSLIRGKEYSDDELKDLTKRLQKATADLSAAEQTDSGGPGGAVKS